MLLHQCIRNFFYYSYLSDYSDCDYSCTKKIKKSAEQINGDEGITNRGLWFEKEWIKEV